MFQSLEEEIIFLQDLISEERFKDSKDTNLLEYLRYRRDVILELSKTINKGLSLKS